MNQKNLATTSQYLHGRSPVGILSNGDREAEARTLAAMGSTIGFAYLIITPSIEPQTFNRVVNKQITKA